MKILHGRPNLRGNDVDAELHGPAVNFVHHHIDHCVNNGNLIVLR